MEKGTMLVITRSEEKTVSVIIANEGLMVEPELWGSLLGDVFKHLVKGFHRMHGLDEEEVIRTMMGSFVLEIQQADDETKVEEIPVLPNTAGDNN